DGQSPACASRRAFGRRGAPDCRADGPHNSRIEETGAVDFVVGTEYPFCSAGVGSCLCAGKGSDSLAGLRRTTRYQPRGAKNLSHGVGTCGPNASMKSLRPETKSCSG